MSARTRAALAAVLISIGGSMATQAHHGGAVEWGDERLGPITGTATKFAFQFPHVYITLDVAEPGGAAARWTLVTRWTPTILREHGWSRESIKPGDRVVATYLPHVQNARVGSILTIDVNGQSLPIDF
jgi:hypothetical protein